MRPVRTRRAELANAQIAVTSKIENGHRLQQPRYGDIGRESAAKLMTEAATR